MCRAAATCSVSAGAPGFWIPSMTTGFVYDDITRQSVKCRADLSRTGLEIRVKQRPATSGPSLASKWEEGTLNKIKKTK